MDGVAAALEGVRQGIKIQEIRAWCTRSQPRPGLI